LFEAVGHRSEGSITQYNENEKNSKIMSNSGEIITHSRIKDITNTKNV
jgi:hypothetical protein